VRGLPGTRIAGAALVASVALGLAACGGGARQDAKEPSGTYTVDVVKASFPQSQHIAGQSQLQIVVRNPGAKTIPNVAVTVEGADGAAPAKAFAEADSQPGLADPSRPVWILDVGPHGGDTAYVNTWALGRLGPNQEKTFTWFVTPIVSGTHTIRYKVAAGLNGKAKAVLAGGQPPTGSFTTSISGKPAGVKVDRNGNVTNNRPSVTAVSPGQPANP
jgi:hypothetical protein